MNIKKYIFKIIIAILLFGTIYTDTEIFYIDGVSAVTTTEFIIYTMNHQINICFYLLFFVLAFSGGLDENFSGNIKTNDKDFIRNIFFRIIFIPTICILAYSIIGILVFYTKYGYASLVNIWSLDPGISISPFIALLMSIILLSMRFIVFSFSSFIVDVISKYPVGMLVPIFLSMIDYWFYEVFDILKPLGILPLEHTRIFYTEAMAPATENVVRCSYGASLVYWILLFGGLFFIFIFVLRKKRAILGDVK